MLCFNTRDLKSTATIDVQGFPKARNPSYILKIDFSNKVSVKKSSAQITDVYSKETLMGKQVVAVVNSPNKQIGPMMSECLVTGFHREDGAVVLSSPDSRIANGTRLM